MAEKISIAWIDLNYKTKHFLLRDEKNILKSLSGSVSFGSINALMGPSGSGKTTLLKCINGNIKSGLGKDSKFYLSSSERIKCCFIGQNVKERLIMCFTAKQNMIYASKLKNSGNNSKIVHQKNALDLLSQLMIDNIENTKVENYSDGQLTRLAIALEMTSVNKSNLLCIDEPTTGLDSDEAEKVINCLKLLSRRYEISIITSINQPNSDTLIMFDKLYVLAKAGICIYSGPPQDLTTHLSLCGIFCIENQVPIEVLIKIASKDSNDEQIVQLSNRTSRERQIILNQCKNETKLCQNGVECKSKFFKPIDLWYLLMRGMHISYISKFKTLIAQLLFYIFFAMILTQMFNSDIGKPDGCFGPHFYPNTTCLKGLEDNSLLDQNTKLIFVAFVTIMFIQLTATTLSFLTDVKIFWSEHKNRWYSTGAYYLAKNIVELFPILLYSTTYGFLVYYLSGQLFEYQRLLWFIFMVSIGMLCTQGLGYLVGILLINYEMLALVFAIGIYTYFSIFCNFYILIKEIPKLFQTFSDFSYMKYIFNSGLILIYGLNRCSTNQYSMILNKFDIKEDQLWINMKTLIIYSITLRFLTLITLCIKRNSFFKRRKAKIDDNIEFEETSTKNKQLEPKLGEYYERKYSVFVIPSNTLNYTESDDESDGEIDPELHKNPNNNNVSEKLSIAWIDLILKVTKSWLRNEKLIIDQISGYLEFGTLTALMGPSGVGKTSLLKWINGVQLAKDLKIYLSKFERIRSCFISKELIFLNGFTVKQHLIYASKLKNSDKNVNHEKNAKNLMKELLINDIANNSIESCSAGEQKRVLLAMELTSYLMPNLICIDELTNGLDSNDEEMVIKCLRHLSRKQNISIITSLNTQPNNDVLMTFDKLYVLAKGGICVYSGSPKDLETHLNDFDIICTENQIPIEVLMKHSCSGVEDKQVVKFMDKTSEELIKRCNNETVLSPNGLQFRSKRFVFNDLRILLSRTTTYTYRYLWKKLLIQFIVYIAIAYGLRLFFSPDIGKPNGCINFNTTCSKTIDKIVDDSLLSQNIKYNYLAIVLIMFFQICFTTINFSFDVKVFLNEHRNGWYSTGIYYWTKSFVELIPLLIIMLLYVYIVDIYGRKAIFHAYLYFIIMGILCIQSLGHIFGIIYCENVKIAVSFSIGIWIIFFMFNNFLIPIKEFHFIIQWLSNISTIKLSFEGIIIAFYGFNRCSRSELSSIMDLFGLKDEDFYRNARLLIFQLIFYRIITFISLYVKANPFKNREQSQESQELLQITETPKSNKKDIISDLNSSKKF